MNVHAWLRARNNKTALRNAWAEGKSAEEIGYHLDTDKLIEAGITPTVYLAYQRAQGPFASFVSPHKVLVLHRSRLTPTVCQSWLNRSADSRFGTALPLLCAEIEAMIDNGVPAPLAGLYALAGYDSNEAVRSHQVDVPAPESLQVQAQLALL